MKVNNNISKEFDYEQIKHNLNTSMEEDDISVSKELTSKTMAKIKQDDVWVSSTTSHKDKRKIGYNFSNVAAVVLLVLLIGAGVVRGISGDYFYKKDYASDKMAPQMNENDKDMSNETDGDFADSVEEIKDSEETASGLVISDVIDLDLTNIETLEVSYYEGKAVINRELTNKTDEVFALFNTYSIEEINPKEDDAWIYKLIFLAKTDDRIYTITIGENMNIVDASELSESNQHEKKAFQVEEVESFKAELEDIISAGN